MTFGETCHHVLFLPFIFYISGGKPLLFNFPMFPSNPRKVAVFTRYEKLKMGIAGKTNAEKRADGAKKSEIERVRGLERG